MAPHPLVFSFRDLIAGNGFVAAVAMDGRVLLSEEEEGCWMYGVQPGSVAGGAVSRQAAFKEFKDGYLSVLFDMAAEATSFEQFEGQVRAFFEQVNKPNLEQWETALAAVRASNVMLDGIVRVSSDSKLPNLLIAKWMQSISITARFSKLLAKKSIVHHGADEHGPIYALAEEDEEDEERGGEDEAPIIN